jgi:hypothetical protein
MPNKKSQKRRFNNLSYREIQQLNSINRSSLQSEAQKWLKDSGYRNVGWDRVISLHQKLQQLLDQNPLVDLSLEELFLVADRIGNKYLSDQEISDFNEKLSKEASEIAEEVDRQFPDTEIEIIDFSNNTHHNPGKKGDRRSYKTVKL